MAIAPAYTNEKCFCERGSYGEGATKIVCGEEGGPQHWAHTRCQRQWAEQKCNEGVPDAQITCALLGIGGCNTKLADLLYRRKVTVYELLSSPNPILRDSSRKIFGRMSAAVGAELMARIFRSLVLSTFPGSELVSFSAELLLIFGGAVMGACVGGAEAARLLYWGEVLERRPPELRKILTMVAVPAVAIGASVLATGGHWAYAGVLAFSSAMATYNFAKDLYRWF